MLPHREQFSGCLIGQCMGDALGFAVEGFSPEACKRYVEDVLKTGRAGEFGHWPFPFGQYSDDSQLARELLQSYIACKKFDPRDYAERIKAIFAERRIVGWGQSTREAALRLIRGVPWEEAGTPAPSASNSSAMRAAPIGLIFFDNTHLLIQAAYDQGRITHKDPRCSAGAVAISGAVALVLQGKPTNPESFLSSLADLSGKSEPAFASELKKLIEWVSMPPESAVTFISKAGIDANYLYEEEWQGISPFVVSSVLWSLYSFLRTPEDYWETICTAIAVGGDVDTTAAMAGAISGAYLGLDAIPSHLSHCLTDRGTWGFNELIELAHQCYEIKMQRLQ
ncbi:MAG: ADP-ribosylglycohydrolase family protein [Thermodesulfovibrionales bacterium]|nr:ADP-ribosylglycohydrolase family protein [Thermodesulfovibrionales bacterium]